MTDPKRIEVARCIDCRFLFREEHWDEDRRECELSHPDALTHSGVGKLVTYEEAVDGPPPEWCFLRESDVLVTLKRSG